MKNIQGALIFYVLYESENLFFCHMGSIQDKDVCKEDSGRSCKEEVKSNSEEVQSSDCHQILSGTSSQGKCAG